MFRDYTGGTGKRDTDARQRPAFSAGKKGGLTSARLAEFRANGIQSEVAGSVRGQWKKWLQTMEDVVANPLVLPTQDRIDRVRSRDAFMTHKVSSQTLSAKDIADRLSGQLIGDGSRVVRGSNFLERANTEELTFVGCRRNLKRLDSTESRVIIAPIDTADDLSGYPDFTFVLTQEPEAAFLQIASILTPRRSLRRVGISDRASVSETACIGAHTNVRDFAVIGDDVRIGDNCDIGSGAVIHDGCEIGDNVILGPNSVLYPNLTIGSEVQIQAGSVLGSDGFGYRTVNGRHEWLPHVGTVTICDDVRIGAGSVIDRAKMGETRIGTGTRIDNLVVIAHNCQIGEHNLLVSQTGIAGSCTTGNYVVCAGQAGIADHVTLGDGAIIGAKAGVHRDMPGGESYLGAPARKAADVARQMSAMTRLPEMRETIKKLERQLEELQQQVAELSSASGPEQQAA